MKQPACYFVRIFRDSILNGFADVLLRRIRIKHVQRCLPWRLPEQKMQDGWDPIRATYCTSYGR